MDNWVGLVTILIIAVLAAIVLIISSSYKEKKLIKEGILPEPEKTTDEDIERLIKDGYLVWALKRYRQKYNVSLKEAKKRLGV